DLKDAQGRLQRVQEERDLLAESHTDAEKAREEVRGLRDELEDIRRERDGVASDLAATREQLETHLAEQQDGVTTLQQQLEDLRAENEALEQRLVERGEEVADWERRHNELAESEANFRRLMERLDEELADVKGRLVEADLAVEDAREKLTEVEAKAAGAADVESLQDELERTRNKLATVEKDHEQNMVQLFDLRTRATRLEEKVDEAQKHERQRVRRILDKIHGALDDVGAPRGDDLSFSERIRKLSDGA
ncbi:MAG: hypothetical protein AAGD14_18735, partial [Planctomycetota bacterium]